MSTQILLGGKSWRERVAEAKQIRENRGDMRQLMADFLWFNATLNTSEVADVTSTPEHFVDVCNALRYAQVCLSAEESRMDIQHEAVVVHTWHMPLSDYLSSKNIHPKVHTRCAQLLSNLITGNAETAEIVMRFLELSQSPEVIKAKMKFKNLPVRNNWTDMVLAISHNREAFGALVATLHNALSILDDTTTRVSYRHAVATNGYLISNILRQMLPSTAAVQKKSKSKDGSPLFPISDAGYADEATEWVILLFQALCRWGYLEDLIASAVGGDTASMNRYPACATPEHLVLLHSLSVPLDKWANIPSHQATLLEHPLGGAKGNDCIMESHLTLAEYAVRLQTSLIAQLADSSKGEDLLDKAALAIIFDMLSNSLSDDRDKLFSSIRARLGPLLLPMVVQDMGVIVDRLSRRNRGVKARDLKVTNEEQRRITTLVRLIGNLCFRSKENQDLIRTTLVPRRRDATDRTALHVLMSCTQFSYGCVTLREWSIVALRNVLEGNLENQAVVGELQAQKPVQNPELSRMGLKVELMENGAVKVVAPFAKEEDTAMAAKAAKQQDAPAVVKQTTTGPANGPPVSEISFVPEYSYEEEAPGQTHTSVSSEDAKDDKDDFEASAAGPMVEESPVDDGVEEEYDVPLATAIEAQKNIDVDEGGSVDTAAAHPDASIEASHPFDELKSDYSEEEIHATVAAENHVKEVTESAGDADQVVEDPMLNEESPDEPVACTGEEGEKGDFPVADPVATVTHDKEIHENNEENDLTKDSDTLGLGNADNAESAKDETQNSQAKEAQGLMPSKVNTKDKALKRPPVVDMNCEVEEEKKDDGLSVKVKTPK